ncbi:ATP-binding cassette domain-containing protein, partial [Streptomyces sp. NPDC044948]|uniref:ATP-binding cassette domain-containing protein n=1 Tax=Streptomyces sp. NPDC044948 TaxID=3157092 RepID=UPI0033DFF4AD
MTPKREAATTAPPSTDGTAVPPLLDATDVRTAFHTPRGQVRAVDGVSLTLAEGETLGIVGESGSGKSVLGRTLMGLITDGPGTTVSGTVRIGGQDVHPSQRWCAGYARRKLSVSPA